MVEKETTHTHSSTEDENVYNDITKDVGARWSYLASIITGLFLLSLASIVILAGLGLITLSAITQGWFILYSTISLMAATWLLGTDTLKAVRESRKE